MVSVWLRGCQTSRDEPGNPKMSQKCPIETRKLPLLTYHVHSLLLPFGWGFLWYLHPITPIGARRPKPAAKKARIKRKWIHLKCGDMCKVPWFSVSNSVCVTCALVRVQNVVSLCLRICQWPLVSKQTLKEVRSVILYYLRDRYSPPSFYHPLIVIKLETGWVGNFTFVKKNLGYYDYCIWISQVTFYGSGGGGLGRKVVDSMQIFSRNFGTL